MAERLKLWTGPVAGALTEATRHVSRQIWIYVFAALIWALVWYGMMDVLTLLNSNPSFPFDVMPIVAGIPIIVVGWRAASLGQELQKAIRRFNDAAAFVFPAGQSGTLGAFLDDLSKTVTRWSRLTAAGIFVIAVVGSLIGSAAVEPLLAPLVVIGVPLISLPIAALLGQLVGYAQFTRIMDRHRMAFSSLASPQARQALRNLESIHVLAVVALFVLCFWFAAWSLVWQFGFAAGYYELWSRQFLILWLVSMALFVVAGFIPALNFKKRVRDLEGGASGRAARERQLQEASDDLRQWREAAAKPSRQQRDRMAELELFIAGLKDQRIHSPWLDARLLFVILFVNAALFAMPFVMPQIDLTGVIGRPPASAR